MNVTPERELSLAGASGRRRTVLALAFAALTPFACRASEPEDPLARSERYAQELIARYRAAHDAGDLAALRELVHWEDTAEDVRARIEWQLAHGLGLEIDLIEFAPRLPRPGSEADRGERDPRLAGWLSVRLVPPPQDARLFWSAFSVLELEHGYALTATDP